MILVLTSIPYTPVENTLAQAVIDVENTLAQSVIDATRICGSELVIIVLTKNQYTLR